ncbi:hypothetical protein RVR_4393 [Actinacidiphila reveromycinica]|uniref:Uncharacterized protein n=1 Tax=Actinacidiphila reveromycinica TaxID=659352 RepID=A0A7U3UQ08_9ACTN|nr:hypothetical protein [Streptomyces sp. SN-593]BBA98265.1 hypothetical protein RVR_4393 [Streptomyces sp. SN-593]
MSDVILAAMIAAFVLLPASVVAHRVATAPQEEPHDPTDCRHCAALFGQSKQIPGQRHGGEL